MMIIPTLTMIIIPSSDTARHSATSGSLDLSIHNTEVQVVVFLTHWCRVLSGDWKPYNTCCDELLSIYLTLSSKTNFILFHLSFSLLHAAVSQVGEGWYLVVQVLNTSTIKQGRCEIFLAKIAPCTWTHSRTIKVGERGFMQTKWTTMQWFRG